jgi:arginyl-tRNA synthetase
LHPKPLQNDIITNLTPSIEKAVQALFDIAIDKVEFQTTRKEFEGDITMVIFPLLKVVK